ncbi:MAG: YihY/virulence factor BrkB family protein [Bacteroidota bacterium]
MNRWKEYWSTLKKTVGMRLLIDTYKGFQHDNPMLYGASIAFYMIFSLPALLIFAVYIAGTIYEEAAITGTLYSQISTHVGEGIAKQIQNILRNANLNESGTVAKTIGFATLIFSATTVFVNIQLALNEIWGVRAKPRRGWLKLIVDRLFSFIIVVSLGLILIAMQIIDLALKVFEDFISGLLSDYTVYLVQVTSFFISIAIVTLVFALIFKLLPDAKIRWRDVWVGALVTTVLFVLGKELIGVYLRTSNLSTSYGTAGSLVILLIWIYYSSVIFLVGAEFTKAYSHHIGDTIIPKKNAVQVIKQEVEREVETENIST